MSEDRRYIIPGLLLLLVVVGGYYYFKPELSGTPDATQEIKNNVHVVRADEGDTKTTPEGFPTDIPIESDIVESYRVSYALERATQYTVGFMTQHSADAVLKTYAEYMKSNGYAASVSTGDYLEGTKGMQTLSVTIGSPDQGTRLVVVNLLVH